jgi:transcriptional regulator
MYVPKHFAMTDEQVAELLGCVEAAELVTAHVQGPVATYLPFVFDSAAGEHGALLTHVARNNRQWSDESLGDALVIVRGTDHYISPRWAPSLLAAGQSLPTWNYVTVHAYGHLVAHEDADWCEDVVRRLVVRHETAYSLDQIPRDFVERQLRATVGIEVRLTRVEAKAKMSQNKMPADVAGMIAGLRGEAADEEADLTAGWMEENSLPAAQRRAALIDKVAREHHHP